MYLDYTFLLGCILRKKKKKIYKSFLKLLLVVTLVLFLKALSLYYGIQHKEKEMKK